MKDLVEVDGFEIYYGGKNLFLRE